MLAEHCKIGSLVEAGELLRWVHARTPDALAAALTRLARAYSFAEAPVVTPPVIHWVIQTATTA